MTFDYSKILIILNDSRAFIFLRLCSLKSYLPDSVF